MRVAYIETVAINIAGRILSRTVTDMWRADSEHLTRADLDARVDSEVRGKVGAALQSTVEDLRAAILVELQHVARISKMVRIDDRGMFTTPPVAEGDEPVVRVVADKKEIHRVLVKLSAATAARRQELRRAA